MNQWELPGEKESENGERGEKGKEREKKKV